MLIFTGFADQTTSLEKWILCQPNQQNIIHVSHMNAGFFFTFTALDIYIITKYA